jgi:hypothetical protein
MSPLHVAPEGAGDVLDELGPGRAVWVLGRYRGFVLVRDPNGLQGWVVALSLRTDSAGSVAESGGAGAAIAALAPASLP